MRLPTQRRLTTAHHLSPRFLLLLILILTAPFVPSALSALFR